MVRLTNPHCKDLSRKHFEQYPIWTWDEEMEYLEPVDEAEPSIKDYNDLFIRAVFTTNGYSFNGYLMGGETFYGFALFIKGKEIGFNFNLPKLIEESCQKIFRLLNCKPFRFFPIAYSSNVSLKEKKTISGTLFLNR